MKTLQVSIVTEVGATVYRVGGYVDNAKIECIKDDDTHYYGYDNLNQLLFIASKKCPVVVEYKHCHDLSESK